MPQFGPALLSLAKLLNLLKSDSGELRLEWFGDPLKQSLLGIPSNREHLGALLRAILDRDYPGSNQVYLGNELEWEPLLHVGEKVQAGFIWTKNKEDDLRIGIGAKADYPLLGQTMDLAVLARLIKITVEGDPSQEFGKLRFGGSLPTPEFLESAGIYGDTDPEFGLELTVNDVEGRSRKLVFPNPYIGWDAVRLAVFVLQAWMHQRATDPTIPPKSFSDRVDKHLFPMLGDPPGLIKPFPLVGDSMGQDFNIAPWKDSIFTTDNDAEGALTFLWHLRALLTGNDDPEFFGGSFYLPLIAGSGAQGRPPTLGDSAGSFTQGTPGPHSIWLGITTENGVFSLFLDFRGSDSSVSHPITLATIQNGQLTRPNLSQNLEDLRLYLESQYTNEKPIGDGGISVAYDQVKHRLLVNLMRKNIDPLLPANNQVGMLSGEYKLQLVLQAGQPVGFRLEGPPFNAIADEAGLLLPPSEVEADAKDLFGSVLQWLLAWFPEELGGLPQERGGLHQNLGVVIHNTLKDQELDPTTLISFMANLLGNAEGITIGPLGIGFDRNGDKLSAIKPSITLGPLDPGDLPGDPPIHIGKITGGATVNLDNQENPIESFEVGLLDVRLGAAGGVAKPSGLVASLLPDLREVPGFSLRFSMPPASLELIGSVKIPIQESIGPLDLVALLIDLREDSISVGIDLSFQLAMITVEAYELGIKFPFSSSDPEPFLHGLAVSADAEVVKLAGMFGQVGTGQDTKDYVGGAVVSVVDLFELTAIGGYTELGEDSSLFVFASLVAPLGGPPWFFITGIAGGFGYNRSLPPPGLLDEHPFMQVMRGDLVLSGDSQQNLVALSASFTAVQGQYWIAAGIQFTSFGFIQGRVVVTVGFGHKFSLTILGLASFGIQPLVYFELGLEVTANEEKFLLKAGLSPNSYLLHPDIFSLRGDFALVVWYGGPQEGDFLLSIGGYHPNFPIPEHYPTLERVGVKCIVYGFIRLSVECFFATTPQAIMAGGAISLSAEFAGIGAGLDVYIDVFITWDPFFLYGRMGVAVWFEFLGRHEIGVDLEIWTPELGGIAVIDLLLVSFEIEFGDPRNKPSLPPPPIDEFVTKILGVPATDVDGVVRVPTFNTESESGLTRVNFLYGRSSEPERSDSSKQEGLDKAVRVGAEFGFSVRTQLPFFETHWVEENFSINRTNLTLCKEPMLKNILAVMVKNIETDHNITTDRQERLRDFFPAACFGPELPTAPAGQEGAREAVGKMETSEPSVLLTEGIIYHYQADPFPPNSSELQGKQVEESLEEEEYPLPVGWPEGVRESYRYPKETMKFAGPAQVRFRPKSSMVNRRQLALEAMERRTWPSLKIYSRPADLQRFTVPFQTKHMSASSPPRTTFSIPVPSSPARRQELFGLNLRVLPPRAPVNLGQASFWIPLSKLLDLSRRN